MVSSCDAEGCVRKGVISVVFWEFFAIPNSTGFPLRLDEKPGFIVLMAKWKHLEHRYQWLGFEGGKDYRARKVLKGGNRIETTLEYVSNCTSNSVCISAGFVGGMFHCVLPISHNPVNMNYRIPKRWASVSSPTLKERLPPHLFCIRITERFRQLVHSMYDVYSGES